MLGVSRTILPSPTNTAPVTLPFTGCTKQTVPERKWKVAASRFSVRLLTDTASPPRAILRSCWYVGSELGPAAEVGALEPKTGAAATTKHNKSSAKRQRRRRGIGLPGSKTRLLC